MSQDISRDTLVHALVGHTGVENQEGTIVLEHIPSYNSTIVFKVFQIRSWSCGIYQGSVRCYPRKTKDDLIYHRIDSYKVDNKNATITLTKKAISNVTIDTGAIAGTLGVGTFCFLVTFI